jgi:hypothetical protein
LLKLSRDVHVAPCTAINAFLLLPGGDHGYVCVNVVATTYASASRLRIVTSCATVTGKPALCFSSITAI